MIPIALAVGTAVLAWLLTGWARRYALSTSLLDVPNDRSSHHVPTPRGGGLAVVVAALAGLVVAHMVGLVAFHIAAALIGGLLLVGTVSWVDDHRQLSPVLRVSIHAIAAVWALAWLGGLPSLDLGIGILHLGWLGSVLATVGLIWLVNLYNFMDGVDAMAAGEAVVVSAVAAAILAVAGHTGLAVASLVVAAAAGGFLIWNLPPARIFMGDVGSCSLGLVFGVLAVASENAGAIPLVLWVLLLGVFTFDSTVTLIRRILGGERWSQPHRTHAYQRAVQAGASHGAVSAASAAITVSLGALVAWAVFRPTALPAAVALGALLLAGLYLAVEGRVPRRPAPKPPRKEGEEKPRALFVVNVAWFFVAQRMGPAVALRERGFEVHVACAPGDGVRELEQAGLIHHPLTVSRRGIHPIRELRTLWQLVRLYQRLRPDLVQHITIKAVAYGGLAARLTRVPAVVHSISGMGSLFLARGMSGSLLRSVVRLVYRTAFRHPNCTVIFENDDDREAFVESGLVAEGRGVVIRGVGVDLERFRPREPNGGPPVVVLAARMLRDKGVGEYVEAARLLRERQVPVRMALVGDTDPGNPTAIPRAQLEAWADEGAVEWWGFQADMPEVYARAGLVCLPSYREGLPTALVEGGASGLPSVATDVPGCREIVRPGVTGLLVPVRDPEALADAIEAFAGDEALRRRMGEAARRNVERHYSRRRVVERTLELYADRLASAGARPCPAPALDPG